MGTITHAKSSSIPDSADTTQIRPSDWNANHVINLVKADVGLSSVDNTSDLNKPISNATQTALDGKAPLSHVGSGGTAHTVATPANAGFMSSADKSKLDGIEAGAKTGTVSSVEVSGGTTGLTTSGGPVTGSGTVTLAGTLAVANGGTGATTAAAARTNLGAGTVSSVGVSGGTTGLTTSGGPVTGSGTVTLAGTLAVANGGTGATTAAAARTNLGATTIGSNVFTLTNPSAITFLKVNADNTVTAESAATFRTSIGAPGLGANTFTGNQTAPDFISTSDETLKADVEPLIVRSPYLSPVKYRYKDSGRTEIGFIAQDIRDTYPEVVFEDDKGILYISYPKLTAVLAAELIEVRTRLNEMESRVEWLLNKAVRC